jgi:hypothetical protein
MLQMLRPWRLSPLNSLAKNLPELLIKEVSRGTDAEVSHGATANQSGTLTFAAIK